MLRAAQREVELYAGAAKRARARELAKRAAVVAVPVAVAVVTAGILGSHALNLLRDREYRAEAREAAKRYAERAKRLAALAPVRAKKAREAEAAQIAKESAARARARARVEKARNDANGAARGAAQTEGGAETYIRANSRLVVPKIATRKTRTDGQAGSLEKNRLAVGALLYLGAGYVGLAVPVMEGETHVTRVAYNKGSTHDSYDLIEIAPEPRAAWVDTEATLSSEFLAAMFLDDVCVLNGNTRTDSVRCFQECLRRAGPDAGVAGRVLTLPTSRDTLLRAVRPNVETIASCVARTILEMDLPVVASGTYVVPVAYFNQYKKNGHQCAFLVHIEGETALVAAADTGETAVKDRDGVAICVFSVTTAKDAMRKLEVLVRAKNNENVFGSADDLGEFRGAVVGAYASCTAEPTGSGKSTGASDPHSSIRALRVGAKGLVSHTQRGGSCAFYSIFWLLGLASALEERSLIFDSTGVKVDVAGVWGCIERLDRALKNAAVGDLRYPLAPIVAAVYSRCAWLDVSALRRPLDGSLAPTRLTLECTVREGLSMPSPADLDVGEFLPTLSDAAAWVQSRGVLGLIDIPEARAPLLVLLAQKANRLLIDERSFDSYRPKAGDHERVVVIAHFLCHLRGTLALRYAKSLVCGMLARCARYAVKIAHASELNAAKRHDEAEYSVNRGADVTTCLPWAAREHCAFLREARGVMPLLFASGSPYMPSQAGGDGADTILDKEGHVLAIYSASHAVASKLEQELAYIVPTQASLDTRTKIGDLVSAWIRRDPYFTYGSTEEKLVAMAATAGDDVRNAITTEFGSCPGGFLNGSITALAGTSDSKPGPFLLGVLHAAFSDEDNLNGRALYDSAVESVGADAMLGAVFRLHLLENKTQEERVELVRALGHSLSLGHSGSAIMRVQACISLQLRPHSHSTHHDLVETFRKRALTASQNRALRYLCTDPRVAALNVTIGLLNLSCNDGPVLSFPAVQTAYVFGNSTKGDKGIMLYELDERGGLNYGPSVPLLELRGNVESQHEAMLGSTEGMYVAARARLPVTQADGSASDDAPWLDITVQESLPTLAHDIDELVAWAEIEDSAGYACSSGKQAIRAYTMPLSWKGPSGRTVKSLKEFARTCRAWTKPPYADLRDLLDRGEVRALKLDRSEEGQELMFAYVTVAVLAGRIEELIRAELESLQSNTSYVVETPFVSWASPATRARLSRLAPKSVPGSWKQGPQKLAREGTVVGTLVFEAGGGVVGRVHENLVNAGCTFDHWHVEAKGPKESELVFAGGLVIRGTESAVSLTLGPGEKMAEMAEMAKMAKMPVFIAASEYWDRTFGAAVVPVGKERVERLVVVPGTRGSSRDETYVSVNWLARSRRRDNARGDPSKAIEHFRRLDPFVVELDGAFLLPAASTKTEDLVALFIAYGYAGSMCGTRLIPLVASRVAGAAHPDMILRALYGASCPLSFYAVCAASYAAFREWRGHLAAMLRCAPHEACAEVRAKMLCADEPSAFEPDRAKAEARVRERCAPTVRYGDCERDFALAMLAEAAAAKKDTEAAKMYDECVASYHHADPWKTAIEASTGRFVRDDQRARLAEILAEPWAVVQMQMGFGKSSVIVPMLVARYLSRPDVRVVIVTQPAHLVAPALRTVGSLVAAQPSLQPVYLLGAGELRDRDAWSEAKLVVVLSTADMQRLVRDHPKLLYENSAVIAHVADEVDEESDPLKCEVIVEGADTMPHYDRAVAKNIGAYYRAALELEKIESKGGEAVQALSTISRKSALRLAAARRGVDSLVYKVNFGLSSDASTDVAVPYVCANKPSLVATFSDIDVAICLLVIALARGMRHSDAARVSVDILAKFGHATGARIIAALDETGKRAYYATQIAMPRLRVSKKETSVSFVDLLGAASVFVGFSGTMGASVRVPAYGEGDPRKKHKVLGSVPVHSHAESNGAVRNVLAGAEQIDVVGAPGITRSQKVLAAIVANVRALRASAPTQMICVVDGSGEFGAFESDLAEVEKVFADLGGVGHFDEGGVVVGKEHKIRYYSHRDARGVDSKMDADTIGLVVLSARSRYNDAAQAAYRLRGLAKGQKVVLVVARDGPAMKDFGLVDELLANEQEHAESAEVLLEGQLAHAAKPKVDAGSFERDVTIYANLENVEVLQTSEKQQQHTQEQTRVTVREGSSERCFQADVKPWEFPTLANGASTKISVELEVLRVSLSPFLTYRQWIQRNETRRRAFAVYNDAAGPRLVVMALAEVWTRYASGVTEYVAYSHDGVRLRGALDAALDAPEGMMLLGRYLCDDQLSLLAEYQLLSYLREEYAEDAQKRAALKKVVACLWNTAFLRQPTKLLHRLKDGDDLGKGKTEAQVLAHIRDDMFGGSNALDAVLEPYVASMYAKAAKAANAANAANASFGKRRFV